MNCPSCGKRVKADASICPFCDAILDASFLGDIPDSVPGDDDTPPPEAPPPRARRPQAPTTGKPTTVARAARIRPAPIPRDPEPEPEPSTDPGQGGGSGGYVNKYEQYWEDDEPRPAARSAPERTASASRAADGASASTGSEELDPLAIVIGVAKGMWAWFSALGFENKLTAGSSVAMILMSLMPWARTSEGDELGIVGWGFVAILLAALAIASIWARENEKFESVPGHIFPKVAIGAGGLAAFLCLVSIIGAFEKAPVQTGWGAPSVSGYISKPAFGAFFALLAACGVGLGGFLTMRRDQRT